MALYIWQSRLSSKKYPEADPNVWLKGDWKTIDYTFAKRLAAFAKWCFEHGKTTRDNKQMEFTELFRTYETQAMYYAEYLQWRDHKILGPHGIKLAAAPGKSAHEYGLAVDVKRTHYLYRATNAELKAFGLCKPLFHKGEYWHVQPIETNGTSSAIFKAYAPIDLVPKLKASFGFSAETIQYIYDFDYPSDFAGGILVGKRDFSLATYVYFTKYRWWKSFQDKLGIYVTTT